MVIKDRLSFFQYFGTKCKEYFRPNEYLDVMAKFVALTCAFLKGDTSDLVGMLDSEEDWKNLIHEMKNHKNQALASIFIEGVQIELMSLKDAKMLSGYISHSIGEVTTDNLFDFTMLRFGDVRVGLGKGLNNGVDTLEETFFELANKLLAPKINSSVYCTSYSTLPMVSLLAKDVSEITFENSYIGVIGYLNEYLLGGKLSTKRSDPIELPSTTEEERKKFDYGISISPIGLRFKGEELSDDKFKKFKIIPRSYDTAIAQHLLTNCKERICFTLVSSILSTSMDKDFRKYLVDNGYIDTIIYLPSGSWLNNGITSALCFANPKGGCKAVRFVDIEKLNCLEKTSPIRKSLIRIDELVYAINSTQEAKGLTTVSYDDIIKQDYRLSPQNYVFSETDKAINDTLDKVETRTLSHIVSFERSLPVKLIDGEVTLYEIGIGDITGGYIYEATKEIKVQPESLQEYENSFLEPNDIVITVKGSIGKVAIISDKAPPAGVGGWVVNSACMILRVKRNSPISPEVLFVYLRSKIGQTLINRSSKGNTVMNLTLGDLKQLEVIIPSQAEQAKIETSLASEKKMQEEVLKMQKKIQEQYKSFWYFE